MATKKTARNEEIDSADTGKTIGHGGELGQPKLRKGTYHQVGTAVEVNQRTYSPNSKNGTVTGSPWD